MNWISCKEQMPRDYVNVLVTFKYRYDGQDTRRILIAHHGVKGWETSSNDHIGAFRAMAWQELPEAYKGE